MENIREKIEKTINTELNPVLKEHGGSISWISFTRGLLVVRMEGQCAYCPSSSITLENVIKPALMQKYLEIKDVILDDSTDLEMIDFALNLLKGGKNGNDDRS